MSDAAMQLMFNPDLFAQGQRLANAMAASQFLPPHLRAKDGANQQMQTVANCYQVIVQAQQWEMDPFQVAAHTFVVGGRLGFDGQLIASIVHSRSGLDGRLRCEYEGVGDNRKVTITGRFKNETESRSIEWTVGQGKKASKDPHFMWTSNPDQKLWYSGVVLWARRHCPEVVLGVRTEGEDFTDTEPIVVAPRTGNAKALQALGVDPPASHTAAPESTTPGELAE